MDERLFHAALVLFDAGNVLHAFDIKKAGMLLPKEALYIDASLPHILSAQSVGFQTWHYSETS